jgi:hypothetical protein
MMPYGHDAKWKIATHKRNSIPIGHAHFPEKFKRIDLKRS